MIILGIETSCDETSVAIIKNEKVEINLISSQTIHKEFGGVVPELSSRAHLQQIIPLVKLALRKTNINLEEIDAFASTAGPGLIGALLVGFTFGKSLSISLNKPFIPVNHIEGHIFSGFLMQQKPEFPYLCSVVSGGHTLLLLVRDYFDIIELGKTNDDAIGEAFDKVSKMIGAGYPGGPFIQKHAEIGNPHSYSFPIGKGKSKYDFSYSGLKTAVLRVVQKEFVNDKTAENKIHDISASFQKAAVEAILIRVEMALNEFNVSSLSLVGGVAANKYLREKFLDLGKKYSKKVVIPDLEYCGDNAAMIALRGKHFFEKGDVFSLESNAFPSLSSNSFSAY